MQPLVIEHNPPGYAFELHVAKYLDRTVHIRMGEFSQIALNEKEVRQLVDWLQGWLDEGKDNSDGR